MLFQALKDRNCLHTVLYPARLSFIEGERDTFYNKCKLKKPMATPAALREATL